MKKGFFVTGTDTGVGKTCASVILMHYFKNQGYQVVGMKPVAAGCEKRDGLLQNDDAVLLMNHASVQMDYQQINPYAFEMPVSPHIAANAEEVNMDIIIEAFTHLKAQADIVIVEGAGGWMVPLSSAIDIADLAKALQLPVILIVAIRLGCINHARLTFKAIQNSGLECAGWLAMCVDEDMNCQSENIQTIKNKISAPLLGVIPYSKDMDFVGMEKNIIPEKLI